MNTNIVNTYLPLYIKNIKKSHGTFITIDLAGTINSVTASLHLWVYLTDWSFIKEGETKTIANSKTIDNDNFKDLCSCLINNIKLVKFTIKSKNMIEFSFDNHYKLILVANLDDYFEDDDLFMLFDDLNDIVICYSPLHSLYIEKPSIV